MTSKQSPLSIANLCSKIGASVPDGFTGGEEFRGITTLEAAHAADVSFLQRSNLVAAAEQSRAGLVIAPKTVSLQRGGVLRVGNVMEAVLTLLEYFHPEEPATRSIHPTAVIDPTASIDASASIAPHVVIEAGATIGANVVIGAHSVIARDVIIGDGSVLHPRVTLLAGTRIGRRVIIHSGAVIGADGFRYEIARGRLCKIPQVGIVVIEDDAEIGANSTIDRASFTETRIGARVKIDNQVHIAHNVEVGSDSIIVAQVGIAGSVKIGRGVMIGGQAGIADNITIGDKARIAGATGVHGNVAAGAEIIGNPALSKREYARQLIVLKAICDQWPRLRPLLGSKREDDAPKPSDA